MKINCALIFSILFNLLLLSSNTKAQSIKTLEQGKPTAIRGLSVVNDNTAWISGSNGYIAITNNGGKSWDWQQIKGYEKSEFRDIEAFSDKEAVIMSSGTPSLVLKTIDGGKNWQEKFRKTDTACFLDAMDFVNKQHGYILGDPINNKFFLMETNNGGESWIEVKNTPDALPGEAAFAASGTCLRIKRRLLHIVSGGKSSRIITLNTGSNTWNNYNLPIVQNKASQGAFSLAIGKHEVIIVGGDYKNDKKTDSAAVIYTPRPTTRFTTPQTNPAGFQSCIEYITGNLYLSTGTSGSNITTDGGKNWVKIDQTSFNVCRKAKHGKLILLAGNGGKIAVFKI